MLSAEGALPILFAQRPRVQTDVSEPFEPNSTNIMHIQALTSFQCPCKLSKASLVGKKASLSAILYISYIGVLYQVLFVIFLIPSVFILGLQTLTKSNLDMLGLLRTKASPILKQSKKTSSRSIAGHGENGMARGEARAASAS